MKGGGGGDGGVLDEAGEQQQQPAERTCGPALTLDISSSETTPMAAPVLGLTSILTSVNMELQRTERERDTWVISGT